MMITMTTVILLMIMIRDESKVLHPRVPTCFFSSLNYLLVCFCCVCVTSFSHHKVFTPIGVHTARLHNTRSSQGVDN